MHSTFRLIAAAFLSLLVGLMLGLLFRGNTRKPIEAAQSLRKKHRPPVDSRADQSMQAEQEIDFPIASPEIAYTHLCSEGKRDIQRACELGNVSACQWQRSGDRDVYTDAEIQTATAKLIKLCKAGNSFACDKIAVAPSGDDEPEQNEAFDTLLQRCLKREETACIGVYSHDEGNAQAKPVLLSFCEEQHIGACKALNKRRLEEKEIDRLDAALKTACVYGSNSRACELYEEEGGKFSTEESAKKEAHMKILCETQGDLLACNAVHYDYEMMRAKLSPPCKAGHFDACAFLVRRCDPTDERAIQAKSKLMTSCESENYEACEKIMDQTERYEGIEQQRAFKILGILCAKGNAEACFNLGRAYEKTCGDDVGPQRKLRLESGLE